MNRTARIILAIAALALSGCITVFPKTKPSQLYRFDGRSSAVAGSSASGARVGVVRAGGSFTEAAAGDRILTITGSEVAYVAQSRWAEPAETLFNEAVRSAFNSGPGPARLVIRGEPARADYTLRLDVQRFEAVYDHGSRAAPEVQVEVHLVLVRAGDRVVVRDETLSVQARANSNRVSAIVEAFDEAVGKAVGGIVQATNASVS